MDRPWKRKFLGYSMTAERTPRLKVAPESEHRLREKLKAEFRRARGRNLDRQMQELRPLLIDWSNYFRHAQVKATFERLDTWIRRRFPLCAMAAVEKAAHAGSEAARSRSEPRTRLDIGLQRSRSLVERRGVAHECGAPDTLL